MRYPDMVNDTDRNRELMDQLNTAHAANIRLLEQLSAAQAASIQINAQLESVTEAAEKKEAELYSKIHYLVHIFGMVDDQRDHMRWYFEDGKIKIAKLQAEVMKLTRELGGQMVSEDVRKHHASWANYVPPPWDVEHEGHEIKIRDGSLLFDGINHVIEWRDSGIECPLSFSKWVIAGREFELVCAVVSKAVPERPRF